MLKTRPIVGNSYNHNNGVTYKVLFIANEHSDNLSYPETIVYQGENAKVWTKTLVNFMEKMNENIKQ